MNNFEYTLLLKYCQRINSQKLSYWVRGRSSCLILALAEFPVQGFCQFFLHREVESLVPLGGGESFEQAAWSWFSPGRPPGQRATSVGAQATHVPAFESSAFIVNVTPLARNTMKTFVLV